MSKVSKNQFKSAAKKLGFFVQGNFFIGSRTSDVISGVAIDLSPSTSYLWRFVLPAFDKIEFLHLTLGQRVVLSVDDLSDIKTSVINQWRALPQVGTAKELLVFLDTNQFTGEYAIWSRFISLIRLGIFDEANALFNSVEELRSAGIPRKLESIRLARSDGGWRAVQALLQGWSVESEALAPRMESIG